MAQAGAAAAEAMALIDKGHIEQEPNTAYILADECCGCKSCIPLCPYTAITFDEAQQEGHHQRGAVQGLRHLRGLLPVAARSCRTCSRTTEIFSEIEGVLAECATKD